MAISAPTAIDERADEEFAAPGDELQRFLYLCSVLHCLLVSMTEPGSAETGTVIQPGTIDRYARAVSVHDPRTRLISNRDGDVVATGREVLERIVAQVSNPVRWDLCMKTMSDLGVTGVIEVPPAGTLTGLIKRGLPGVETVALKTPADLEAARDLVARHGSASPMDGSPTWRLLVAKAKGVIHISEDAVGTQLTPGATVATLVTSRDEHAVVAPHGGTIVEWLVEDGDPVAPGQPIIRLHPEAVHS